MQSSLIWNSYIDQANLVFLTCTSVTQLQKGTVPHAAPLWWAQEPVG